MIVRLKGNIEKLLPTSVELEVSGITYMIEISLLTSVALQNKTHVTLEIAEVIREDSHLLYGFETRSEREIFLQLLKVNGVGAKIALMILSNYSADQFLAIVQTNNLAALKSVKGVGAKVAGKIMLELANYTQNIQAPNNINVQLAHEALNALGFKDTQITQALQTLSEDILQMQPNDMVKALLQTLGKS
ncbi:Holliday junction branch migration protein RuvA [Helicobacter trogontum]|uniref:Holliday junction branch migration complex subunit RuvA n=1 Tax=Helicobacter trogontum TaxID=50960 RepID=A0A4U8T8R1_9HELI|nr:Holliday junction branch migration protein RuvA [Helicobacter trogontum]MDY5184676.1 Holliday junction branch migration protein RuvA [Helicobacter trogontum]TLD96120.1 Holliday junction branch migration protein RuvA [Helicobacter trogontum]